MLVVIGVATGVPYLLTPEATQSVAGQSTSNPSQTTPTPATATPTPLAIPTPTVAAPAVAPLPTGGGDCPSPHDARSERRVDVEVFWWCLGYAINEAGEDDGTQFQLKVRLGITANPRGTTPVSISTGSPSTIRLLVNYFPDLAWTPPPGTAAAGDKPVCVYIDGVPYWAIPPNVNDDAQMDNDGVYNFASHWDPADWGHPDALLLPSEFIGDDSHSEDPAGSDGRGRSSADLVFTVPIESYRSIYGIGLYNTAPSPDPTAWTLLGDCKQTEGCMSESNRRSPSTF